MFHVMRTSTRKMDAYIIYIGWEQLLKTSMCHEYDMGGCGYSNIYAHAVKTGVKVLFFKLNHHKPRDDRAKKY